jgi:hypothetical protein
MVGGEAMMLIEFIGGAYDGERMEAPEAFTKLVHPEGDCIFLAMRPEEEEPPADELIRVLTYEREGRKHPNGPLRYRLKV